MPWQLGKNSWGGVPEGGYSHTHARSSTRKPSVSDFAISLQVCLLPPRHLFQLLFSLSFTHFVGVCTVTVSDCNPLTARLIGKCGVFVWHHSSSSGSEAATCSSIILLFCPAVWISLCSDNRSLIHTHTNTHTHSCTH